MLKAVAALVLILATMTSATAQDQQKGHLPIDLHTYTCGWFLSDLDAADHSVVAVEERKRLVSVVSFAAGFFQARVDLVSKAEPGKEPFLASESLQKLVRQFAEGCKQQPNALTIDVVRSAAANIQAKGS